VCDRQRGCARNGAHRQGNTTSRTHNGTRCPRLSSICFRIDGTTPIACPTWRFTTDDRCRSCVTTRANSSGTASRFTSSCAIEQCKASRRDSMSGRAIPLGAVRDTPRRLKIAAGLVATLLTLVLCEIAARMLYPAPPDPTRQPPIVYLYDPEIRYVLAP